MLLAAAAPAFQPSKPAPAAPGLANRLVHPVVAPLAAPRALAAPRMAISMPEKSTKGSVAASIDALNPLPISVTSDKTPNEVVLSLAMGNQRFVKKLKSGEETDKTDLVSNPFAPTPVEAIIISCSRSTVPVESVFDVAPGSIHSLRVCGNVVQARDAIVGSVEFALEEHSPPAIVVMGSTGNDVIASAVARAMTKAGRKDVPKMAHLKKLEGESEKEMNGLLKVVEGPVADALAQSPNASFEELCALAAEFNVWKSVETLLTTSRPIAERVMEGKLQVHGAVKDPATGRVSMLGEHPSKADLLVELPSADLVRSAAEPTVPADEALAALYAGNKRYTTGKGGLMSTYDRSLLQGITDLGQNPIAIILGCADSRAPAELFFDARPGDLFILRNAGNTLVDGMGSTLGSAEYAVGPLDTKLIVVTGHTKCGAVTAALQTVQAGKETSSVGGSIGNVLDDIVAAAKEALEKLPDADLAEQVKLATEINVFNAMEKVIRNSASITEGVKKGDVQVVGSVYDIATGEVKWLGPHPKLAEITGVKMPVHEFKTTPYKSLATSTPKLSNTPAGKALGRLLEGNKRFASGKPSEIKSSTDSPFGIVLGSAELRLPLEKVFDVDSSELIVQRVEGSIAGRPGSTLFSSIEYSIQRWDPKVLMVVADSNSEIVDAAVEQVSGGAMPTAPMRGVLDRVMVSAMRAKKQVEAEATTTAAGKTSAIRQLTTELNALYSIEQLLKSKVIREAVRNGLELHASVLDEKTGLVKSLGQHPALEGLLDESRY